MSEIVYLANPKSPHVTQWLELEVLTKPIKLYHIGAPDSRTVSSSDIILVAAIPSQMQRLPNITQYFILGLILRLRLKPNTIIHAHNSSGYGLSALLSSRHYIVTTYGTEVFGASHRGKVYIKLLNKVLQKADIITSTSNEMTKTLLMMNSNLQAKIRTFSLGISEIFHSQPRTSIREKAEPKTWFVNRRIHPHYDTDIIVDAFINFLENGGTGRLQLLKGDADSTFLKKICSQIESFPEISIVDRFLDKREMISYLDQADFCISIPRSDQLSSSILEGMARGCVQILAPLETYKQAKLCGVYLDNDLSLYDALCRIFDRTSRMSEPEISILGNQAEKMLETMFSKQNAQEKYICILKSLNADNMA